MASKKNVANIEEVTIAADAIQLDDHRFDSMIPHWRKLALKIYNAKHESKFAHPYEYVTRAAPSSRTARTFGDVYCRFCGERLLERVKDPHALVKTRPLVERHLTLCALQVLCGIRKASQPGHRALPMEWMWES